MNLSQGGGIATIAEWVQDHGFERGIADFADGKTPDEAMESSDRYARPYAEGRLLAAFAQSRGMDISTVRRRTKAFRAAHAEGVFPSDLVAAGSSGAPLIHLIDGGESGFNSRKLGLRTIIGGHLGECIALGMSVARLRKVHGKKPGGWTTGEPVAALAALKRAAKVMCAACGAEIEGGVEGAGGVIVADVLERGVLYAAVACDDCSGGFSRPTTRAFVALERCADLALAAFRGEAGGVHGR